MLALCCVVSAGAKKKRRTINLEPLGRHRRYVTTDGKRGCKFITAIYGGLAWIDDDRVAVAFNTTPECSPKPGEFTGHLKVVVLRTDGTTEASKDIDYPAVFEERTGMPSFFETGGMQNGPAGTLVVEFVTGSRFSKSGTRESVMVLSPDLRVKQRINGGPRGSFGGLSNDGRGYIFYSIPRPGAPHECVVVEGEPLKQRPCERRDQTDGFYRVPAEYGKIEALEDLNVNLFRPAANARRAAIIASSNGVGLCEMGILCFGHSRLFVIDAGEEKPVLETSAKSNTNVALSPSGKRLAVLEAANLEIIDLP